MAKDKDYRRLIHTSRWLALRRQKLTACPLCERCSRQGRITPATEVHHVRPVEDALSLQQKAALMFDPHNLMSLCHKCHVEVHTQLGRSGKAHARRKAEEQLNDFRSRFLPPGGNPEEGAG